MKHNTIIPGYNFPVPRLDETCVIIISSLSITHYDLILAVLRYLTQSSKETVTISL